MTHARSDAVPLPVAEPRCTAAAKTCERRSTCARYTAGILRGSPLGDYSLEAVAAMGMRGCVQYVDARTLRAPAPAAPVRKVHPPIGSAS